MLYLKELNWEDSEKEYEFFQKMPSENGFVNEYQNITYETFMNAVIPSRILASKGIDLLEGYVPDSYYFLWYHQKIIGLYRIRHHLNAFLAQGPGHIGYGVLPDYRGLGYGTKGLAFAIDVCKRMIPENEIYMSCWKSNHASLAIQIKNGAYIHHEDDQEYYTRIRIE